MLKIRTKKEKISWRRSRNIIWSDSPFSQNVRTNIAKSFLCLIDKHFPSRTSSTQYSIQTTSRSTTVTLRTWLYKIIGSHNKKILNDNEIRAGNEMPPWKKNFFVVTNQKKHRSNRSWLLNIYNWYFLADNTQSDGRLEGETRVTGNTFLLIF